MMGYMQVSYEIAATLFNRKSTNAANSFNMDALLPSIIICMLCYFTSAAGQLVCCSLEIHAGPLEPVKGTLRVALFNRADRFMKEPFSVQQVKVEGRIHKILFEELPEGEYAFSIFHDVNDNGRLDTGWLGIPTEPWGFSNNARGRFGPPAFEAARFFLSSKLSMAVQLNR